MSQLATTVAGGGGGGGGHIMLRLPICIDKQYTEQGWKLPTHSHWHKCNPSLPGNSRDFLLSNGIAIKGNKTLCCNWSAEMSQG